VGASPRLPVTEKSRVQSLQTRDTVKRTQIGKAGATNRPSLPVGGPETSCFFGFDSRLATGYMRLLGIGRAQVAVPPASAVQVRAPTRRECRFWSLPDA